MLKIFLFQLLFVSSFKCFEDYELDEIDPYQDYPKGVYRDQDPRKEEDLDLASMTVINENKMYRYKPLDLKWKDERPVSMNLKPQNTRKMIKEFYSFNHSSRWPNNIVPYEVSPELAMDTFLSYSVQQAIKHWEGMTCIKFERFNHKKHSRTHKAKLMFTKVDIGCFSEVGYPDFTYDPFDSVITKRIFLERNCLRGQVIHEIGHTIGFFHEHSRNDRDRYVEILWNNIAFPNFNSLNFDIAGDRLEKDNLNIPYDVNSIMHYPANAFAKNFKKTIQVRDKNLEFLLGNRDSLSFYDTKTANIAYKCSSKCKKNLKCQNDGYLGPKCKCICPQGLTGKLCEKFISKSEKSIPLEKANLTCDFSYSLCSWSQEKYRDEIDFIINKGKSFTSLFLQTIGIPNDRNSSNSSYLYLDSYYVQYPHESAQLKSPLLTVKKETDLCLSFWYHMFGNPMVLTGELAVYLHEPSKGDNLTKIWSRAGRQDQNLTEWLQARIDVKVSSNFRIVFKAKRFASYLGDIGLDDVQLDLGTCPEPDLKPSNWTQWYLVSGCFLPCGTEYFERRRFCQVGNGDNHCQGPDVDLKLCPNPACGNLTETNSTMNMTFSEIKLTNLTSVRPVSEPLKVSLDLSLRTFKKCGEVIHLNENETIQITSPEYPDKHPFEIECSYLIKSLNRTKIKINVEYLNLESTVINTCPDSLEIRYFALGQPGLKLCGNYSKMTSRKPLEFTSENDSILIVFRSDWINTGGGFLLKAKHDF